MNQKAFTLIELLVVISIISLLSSVVFASLSDAREKGRIAAIQQSASSLHHATADALVGEWLFDEGSGTSVQDVVDGDNGTLSDAGMWSGNTVGGTGNSVSYNGTSDCVTTTKSMNGMESFTISGWIYPTNLYPASTDRISLFGQNDRVELGLRESGGEWSVGFWTPHGWMYWPYGPSFVEDKWHFILLTADSGGFRLYVDGSIVDSISSSYAAGTTAYTFNIGCYVWNTGGNFFEGNIDTVRLYERSLTASEVRRVYASDLVQKLKIAQQ
jgi:prepilin-type N-terminal cleavage/methylation domain-containing protein